MFAEIALKDTFLKEEKEPTEVITEVGKFKSK